MPSGRAGRPPDAPLLCMAHQERQARSVSLRDAWEELKRVRASIEDYFADCTEELRAAATMTALELTENVLKYGAEPSGGLVTMAEENGEVVIATQNRVDSVQMARVVHQRIECIRERGARELY